MRSISITGIITVVAGKSVLFGFVGVYEFPCPGLYSAGFDGDGGAATSAKFNGPTRVSGNTLGVLYIGDTSNSRVRKVSTSGIITTFAGYGSSNYEDNLPPTAAGVYFAADLFTDSSNGDFYMSAYGGHRVLILGATSGLVTTLGGTGAAASNGDGGASTSAAIRNPDGLYLTSTGALYVCDTSGYKLRSIYSTSPTLLPTLSPTMVPTTTAPTLSLNPTVSFSPTVIPTSARGSQNSVSTIAGTGSTPSSGTGGLAVNANMNRPRAVFQDTAGVIYFSEDNSNCLRKFSTSDNIVQVFAGSCSSTVSGSSGDGGPASSALLYYPIGVFISSTSVVYIADNGNNRVRSVSAAGIISNFAGDRFSSGYSGDGGPASSAVLYNPVDVWGNRVGVVYVVSASGYVRSVSNTGIITTFAGELLLHVTTYGVNSL